MQDRLIQLVREYGDDILASENFRGTKEHIQHGTVSVYAHCISVARNSLILCHLLRIRCNRRELVRGALLHDYFLYDWHDQEYISPLKLHGFFHPGIALKNASAEFRLSSREKDIIKKHMWPMTVVPPLCREAWIVAVVDKYCSICEIMRVHRGRASGC